MEKKALYMKITNIYCRVGIGDNKYVPCWFRTFVRMCNFLLYVVSSSYLGTSLCVHQSTHISTSYVQLFLQRIRMNNSTQVCRDEQKNMLPTKQYTKSTFFCFFCTDMNMYTHVYTPDSILYSFKNMKKGFQHFGSYLTNYITCL